MITEKKYYAKLMLAGEYGVIHGGEAITVPLRKYHAQLAIRKDNNSAAEVNESVEGLRKLLTYTRSLPRNSFYAKPNLSKFEDLLKKNFYVRSNIPGAYGLGSSGAVSALIYDQFFNDHDKLDIYHISRDLATLESCFHGRSSGVDATTCFINTPLHFRSRQVIETISNDPLRPPGNYRFFLIDSKHTFETGPLVNYYLEMLKDQEFNNFIQNEYLPLTSRLIASLKGESGNDPGLLFRAVSDLQWKLMRKMIPENMEEPWLNGQVSNNYYLKINGSGGGYLLGIAANESVETVNSMLTDYDLIWL